MATPEEMDLAAPDAENGLSSLVDKLTEEQCIGVATVAHWLVYWTPKVGYKRLCRILKQYAE